MKEIQILHWAADNGHLDVIKFLISTKVVDPSKFNNYLFRWAILKERLDLVEVLLPYVIVRGAYLAGSYYGGTMSPTSKKIVKMVKAYNPNIGFYIS